MLPSMCRARPKSSIFTKPSGRVMRFSGLMSRRTMPAACAAASANATRRPQIGHLSGWVRPAAEVPQRNTIDQFHNDFHRGAVAHHVIDNDDIRVVEGGRRLSLAEEPGDGFPVPY